MKFLVVLVVLVCAMGWSQGSTLRDPAATLRGDYKLIYSWPRPGQLVPNCSPVHISAVDSTAACSCGRKSANIGLISLQSRSRKFTLLADVVSNGEELKSAVSDSCTCGDGDIDRSVVLNLDGGYILHLDPVASKGFVIGSAAPTADQLQGIISGLPLDAKDGSLVCQ